MRTIVRALDSRALDPKMDNPGVLPRGQAWPIADAAREEKAILTEITINEGKPAAAAEKIVEGRLNKFFSQICLLEQTFVKNDKLTIEQLINEKIATIGEKISIRRFVRYAVGEGMEKKVENLADVVQAEIDKRK